MKFTKMQGCGNDYIYVNGFAEKVESKEEVVRNLSDRHFGIGGDGVIFINPSPIADFEMEMYNADGTRSEMCGNGIRCVAKYVYEKGLIDKTEFTVESFGEIKHMQLFLKDNKAEIIRVNMGAAKWKAKEIPVITKKEQVIKEPIKVEGKEYYMTCISMGNPHAVVFMDEIDKLEIEKIGPAFENHPSFPNRTNTEFVKVIDKNHVKMRVWERGTGETLACGTGCCAVAVASVLNGLTQEKVNVEVLGGSLEIEWNREENVVYMTGPAEIVFEGEVKL